MPRFDPQKLASSVKRILETTPDLPDDLRAKYKAILDKLELREILANALEMKRARMQAEGQTETQDAAPSHTPSERTKETR